MNPIKQLHVTLYAILATTWIAQNVDAIKYLPSQSLALAEASLSVTPFDELMQEANGTSKSVKIPNSSSQKKSSRSKKGSKRKGSKSKKSTKKTSLSFKLPI
jgi:hypothetical protein